MRSSVVVAGCFVLSAGCVDPATDAAPSVAWAELSNPIFGLDSEATKDAFLVHSDASGEPRWHLGFSHISDDPFRFRVGLAESTDLSDIALTDVLDDENVGGLASPTVVARPAEHGGGFVMTFNSHTTDVGATQPKLYFRTSDDLVTWSAAQRFHVDGVDADDDRLIDAALAYDGENGAFLFFKREQTAALAHSATGSLDGPWTFLGELAPGNLENVQPIQIDGVWHLLGTTIPIDHRPVLHRLDGDPGDPQSWLTWTVVNELVVPGEDWNTGTYPSFERSNAAFLVDRRDDDGFFYLLYAGSTDLGSFEGRGHARLGLARSTDLVDWAVPPG